MLSPHLEKWGGRVPPSPTDRRLCVHSQTGVCHCVQLIISIVSTDKPHLWDGNPYFWPNIFVSIRIINQIFLLTGLSYLGLFPRFCRLMGPIYCKITELLLQFSTLRLRTAIRYTRRRAPFPVLLFIIVPRLPRAQFPPDEPPAAVFRTTIYQYAIYYAQQ